MRAPAPTLTRFCAPTGRSGRLERVLPQWCGSGIDVHAVWPSNRRLPGKAQTFMDFIAKRLAEVR